MYRQVTREERYFISGALAKGLSKTFIARFLGRHRSTIHREIERNKDCRGHYKVWIAHGTAQYRRRKSRQKSYFPETVWTYVKSKIKTEWAPEQIAGKMTLTGGPRMHPVTIYREIKRDKRKGGRLFKHLRQANKKRRKGYGRPDSRGVLQGKRNISERPLAATERLEQGHWEADLMRGKGGLGWILTLVERKTGYSCIRKLKNKSAQEVNRQLSGVAKKHGIKTFTVDNGCEFHGYKEVEAAAGSCFYFANPHRSWERGSVENLNGLIRQYFPKDMPFEEVTQAQCEFVMNRLNQRPRKRLNFKTPEESYYGV